MRAVMKREAHAKTLPLRMYVICSECARLIDLDNSRKPQRKVEAADLIRHEAEDHQSWLEVSGHVDEA